MFLHDDMILEELVCKLELTIVCLVHNRNIVFLRIHLRPLDVSSCNSSNDHLGMRPRGDD